MANNNVFVGRDLEPGQKLDFMNSLQEQKFLFKEKYKDSFSVLVEEYDVILGHNRQLDEKNFDYKMSYLNRATISIKLNGKSL